MFSSVDCIQRCESSDFNVIFFLILAKLHFQTFITLKSTSFQAFQIISDFFSQTLSHPYISPNSYLLSSLPFY